MSDALDWLAGIGQNGDTDIDPAELEEFAGPGKFDQPDPDGPADAENRCEHCQETFKTLRGLKRHVTQSHPEAPGSAPSGGSGGKRAEKTDPLREQAEAFCMFFYKMAGGIWAQADPVCGAALVSCYDEAVDAWYQAAKKNKTIAKMIGSVENVGIWGGLIMAHWPLVMAVQAHHVRPMIEERRRAMEDFYGADQPGPETDTNTVGTEPYPSQYG